ncbi:MAG TPA: DNA methyltransferase, partial [Pyrinomonadaceae bacterium]|nr:DNA methyltransferase [Pyrinomonadaceae bacterium]
GGQTDEFFVTEHEYITVYRKSNDFCWADELSDDDENAYNKSDESGKFKAVKLAKWGTGARKEDRPTMHFPLVAPNGEEILPIAPDGNPGRWRVGKERMKHLLENELILWEKKDEGWRAYEKIYYDENKSKRLKMRSIFYKIATTADGTNELTNLFDVKDVFDNPKPTALLKELIKNNLSNNDFVLDFFAGSGTIANAVLELNAEEGTNRKFICVQIPEETKRTSAAFRLKYKTILEVTKERIRRASLKIKSKQKSNLPLFAQAKSNGDNPKSKIHNPQSSDLGFKVFRLERSNFRAWTDFTGQKFSDFRPLLESAETPFVAEATNDGILNEILLLEGFPLNSKVTLDSGFQRNKVHRVTSEFSEHRLFITLDDEVWEETIDCAADLDKNDIFICLDNSLNDESKVRLADVCRLKTI